jgi:hypothetical protein
VITGSRTAERSGASRRIADMNESI